MSNRLIHIDPENVTHMNEYCQILIHILTSVHYFQFPQISKPFDDLQRKRKKTTFSEIYLQLKIPIHSHGISIA